MPTQDQEFSIDIGQGLDKKTDPKAVAPGKLLLLENAVFTEGHQIAKRYGYNELGTATYSTFTGQTGTLVAPTMAKAYNGEFVCQDNGRLYSYSPTENAWADKGPYESIAVSKTFTSSGSGQSGQIFQSACLAGNYMVLAWQQQITFGGGTGPQPFATVLDTTTNTKVIPDTILANQLASALQPTPKSATLAGTNATVFYVNTINDLACRTFVPGALPAFAAEVAVRSDPHLSNSSSYTATYVYDVVGTATGGFLAYYSGTGLTVCVLNSTGVATSSTTLAAGATLNTVTVCLDPTGINAWVYWCDNSTYHYAIVNATTLATVLGATAITASSASPSSVTSMAPVADSATQQTVLLSSLSPSVAIRTVTSTGTVTSLGVELFGMSAFTKPFYVGTSKYVAVLFQGAGQENDQATLFLLNINTASSIVAATATYGYPVAKIFQGEAPLLAANNAPSANYILPQGLYLSPVIQIGTTYIFHSAYLSETVTLPNSSFVFILSSALASFDFGSKDAYQALQTSSQLLLNGGVVSMYDGNSASELGFDNFPLLTAPTQSGSVGVPTGAYTYFAVYQWIDDLGNLHQSSPSAPLSVSVTGPKTLSFNIPGPYLTTKYLSPTGAITVALFRTQNDGVLAFLVGVGQTRTLGGTVFIVDTATDSQLVSGAPLYINGNVLENDTPPPTMLMNSHNNRVFAVDSTDPSTVWYAKTNQEGVGISFSGALLLEVDSKGGAITGMAELDDKQILFKQNDRIVILYGDGANDTGTGSTFSQPQFVQTDVGCSYSKSIISQPSGLLFKSPKGWYQLDRSTAVSYIGFEVESYNLQDVTSAVRMADKTLCVFLTSSGSALAYDYFFNQWSVFTNHTGLAADVFQGLYTYLRTDGTIYQQNLTSYLDSTTTYLMRLQTSWLRLNKIQGFQRVKRLISLGDQLSPLTGHGIQISAAYDFIPTFSTPVPYLFPSTGGPFQYREMLPRQKCDTVSLLIEEVSAAAGQTGEFIDLTDLGFLAGIKKGPNKLPAGSSVG